nr:Ig-like domain-containing protein [Salmonella enterica]
MTVPTDVNVVRLSIDGGKTWFNATQGATPGAWDYIWPDDVADGGYTLTVEATDKAGNQTTQKLDFIIDTLLSERPTRRETRRRRNLISLSIPLCLCRPSRWTAQMTAASRAIISPMLKRRALPSTILIPMSAG